MNTTAESPDAPDSLGSSMWPYVLPMAAFLLLTSLEGYLPRASEGGAVEPRWYVGFYALKVLVVAAVAVLYRRTWRDLLPWPGPRSLVLAVCVGLAVTALWVGLERVAYPRFGMSGPRQAFDPNVLGTPAKLGFLAVRFFGLVALVPLVEELFWRSFLMRWIIDPDFQRVPIGRVTWAAAAVTSALFAAAHPEWLPALITGGLWAWLLHETESLSACLVSHAVANLALGVFVLATGSWILW